jgi:hypothetical protein
LLVDPCVHGLDEGEMCANQVSDQRIVQVDEEIARVERIPREGNDLLVAAGSVQP